MIHDAPHPLADQTLTLDDHVADPSRELVVPGAEFVLEDWWDRISGKSWSTPGEAGNPAVLHYCLRIGGRLGLLYRPDQPAGGCAVPLDDEVVYGKIRGSGHLVHVSELPR